MQVFGICQSFKIAYTPQKVLALIFQLTNSWPKIALIVLPVSTTHLIVDLEATCSDDGSIPKKNMEIIEIGALMISAGKDPAAHWEFQSFIRPVRHPILTNFCKELTHISQEMVNAAPSFREAMEAFAFWIKDFELLDFCSWGNYDAKQLQQDCEFHGIPNPLATVPHRNLKEEFSQYLTTSKRYGMGKALRRLNLPLEGTHHRAIDDARNIAKIFEYLNEPR